MIQITKYINVWRRLKSYPAAAACTFSTRVGDAGLLLCAGEGLRLRLSAGDTLRLRLPPGEPLLLRLCTLGLRLPTAATGDTLRLRDAPRLPTAGGEALRLLPDTDGLRLVTSAGGAFGLLLRLPLLLRAGELARLPLLAGEPLGDLL